MSAVDGWRRDEGESGRRHRALSTLRSGLASLLLYPWEMLEDFHAGPSAQLDHELVRRLVQWFGSPPLQIELWDGYRVREIGEPVVASIRICDRNTLWKVALQGGSALASAYCDRRIEVEGDLVSALTALFRVSSGEEGWRHGNGISKLRETLLRNGKRRARSNAAHHYDLGNEFYALWLDRDLSYTCAYYANLDATLEQAQTDKLDHVARKLRLEPGERVVEAGGGWGALALHLARNYGVTVRSYNVSSEQVRFARARAREANLASCVEFVEDDYRNIQGCYDAFVSVGMLEHVGRSEFPELTRVLDRCLGERGRGMIHAIGRMRPTSMDPWIAREIFPGAYIPALREMIELLEPTNLEVLDVENLRLHYARTLEQWLERYEARVEQVRAQFGSRFARQWRLYLASSIATFRTSHCQLFQVLFARPGYSRAPMTRAHWYAGPSPLEG